MGAVSIDDRTYTYEEYIKLLTESDLKIEYLDGELRMMSGASQAHVDIRDTLQGELYLRKGSCKVMGSDQAVFIKSSNRYYYPDISITCRQKPEYTSSGISQLTNPTCMVEVLSESTEVIDRTEKFHAYFSLPSLKEYVLVHREIRRVDIFHRSQPGYWSMRSYPQTGQVATFETLGVAVPLNVIYADLKI